MKLNIYYKKGESDINMIVTENDVGKSGKLQYKKCDICNNGFQTGQSYEKITGKLN
jgi:hypothetical protein